MPVDAALSAPALLKLLGEPLRWSIIQRLAAEDLCVCHLVDELDAPQPLVSHHLRALRQAGVVTAEPCGAFTYYMLDRTRLASVTNELATLSTAPRRARRRPCS